jgi:hypothetical protein
VRISSGALFDEALAENAAVFKCSIRLFLAFVIAHALMLKIRIKLVE